jgi:hypothetical protein
MCGGRAGQSILRRMSLTRRPGCRCWQQSTAISRLSTSLAFFMACYASLGQGAGLRVQMRARPR